MINKVRNHLHNTLKLDRMALLGFGVLLLASAVTIGYAADASITISQKFRSFRPKQIEIHAGDTLHVVNDDEFTHQIYVESPSFNFDSDEHAPGDSVDVKFPIAGNFTLLCHIHPKMKLDVTVK